MAYTPIIPTQVIKDIISGYVNVEDRDNDILSPNSRGKKVSDELLIMYQEMAENTCLGKLANYYIVPLQNLEGSTDIDEFGVVTAGIIKNYLTAFTVYTVGTFQPLSIGSVVLQSAQSNFENQVRISETLLIGQRENGGQMYATREDLKLSNQFIPRSKTPTISVSAPNTRYSRKIDFNSILGGSNTRFF
jgi:hypothetical protein|tara:strand:+ start:638 stop:1207 length:570 start_codon:yes stop_codon:yes gene_type:complete